MDIGSGQKSEREREERGRAYEGPGESRRSPRVVLSDCYQCGGDACGGGGGGWAEIENVQRKKDGKRRVEEGTAGGGGRKRDNGEVREGKTK